MSGKFRLLITSLCCILLAGSFLTCNVTQKELVLTSGLVLNKSVKIKKDHYFLKGADSIDQPVLTISGSNLTIDFNGATLQGSQDKERPNLFNGLGILVKDGQNVKIKNLIVKGYKVGLMAIGVDSFQLTDSNLSYNYRQQLKSTREKENIEDWMSYHHNEKEEWLRYGAAIYLKNCDHALVKNVHVTGGQNALLLTNCNEGLFYNNTFVFNSALGIGMYRSSKNRVMHNKLDWCIRGFSYGIYNRGQDSAGILAYEQSSDNIFAYNSATHSGDGFFLWAGQSTMDSGTGGCNNNLVYGNDFSQASNNGVEITFSSNKIINNKMEACDYGIWGGYSYETLLLGNQMKDNRYGIAIEHGNTNVIDYNHFDGDQTGVKLFERGSQPVDWGFAQNRNVQSRDYEISNNLFTEIKTPLEIKKTKQVNIHNNQFYHFQALLDAEANEDFTLSENQIYQIDLLKDAYPFRNENDILNGKKYKPLSIDSIIAAYRPAPIDDGMNSEHSENQLRGRQYILINEWGPYDFRYPAIWLRTIENNTYTFALFGPQGNWKIVGGNGFKSFSRKTGAMPATMVAEKEKEVSGVLKIDLEYIGEEVINVFGDTIKRGTVIPFEPTLWRAGAE